jgi:hypothetical protein
MIEGFLSCFFLCYGVYFAAGMVDDYFETPPLSPPESWLKPIEYVSTGELPHEVTF